MSRPRRAADPEIEAWLTLHEGWERRDDGLERLFRFDDFGAALAFAVRVGAAAERKDHHPDVELGWGRAKLRWSTHDAGGITSLDFALAELSERFASEGGAR